MLKAFAGSSRSTATCIARPAGLLKPASFYFFRCRQPGFRLKIATSFGLIIVPSGVRLCKRALAENASAAGPQAKVNVINRGDTDARRKDREQKSKSLQPRIHANERESGESPEMPKSAAPEPSETLPPAQIATKSLLSFIGKYSSYCR